MNSISVSISLLMLLTIGIPWSHSQTNSIGDFSSGIETTTTAVIDGSEGEDTVAVTFPPVATVAGRPKLACRCGVPKSPPPSEPSEPTKVVGGEPAKISEYPWTVGLAKPGSAGSVFGLGQVGKPFCGGTLINSQWVVTASHCVAKLKSPSAVQILLNLQGDFQSTFNPTSVIVSDVEQIKMHEAYNPKEFDNDIALIKLAKPVTIADTTTPTSTYIVPTCLPLNNDNLYTDYNATLVGWGRVFAGGPQAIELQKITAPVLSPKSCKEETGHMISITDNMLCAGYLNSGGKDACHGDSGGPLIIQEDGVSKLIGLVSWGLPLCAAPRHPAVYCRVGRYAEWIKNNVPDGEWCDA